MVVLNSKAFKLPRVDKEKFLTLLRLGLEYDRNEGVFSIKSYNNIEKLLGTIESILGTEVVFLQSCTRCGRDFPCKECNYKDMCTTKDLPFSCVCPQCLRDRKNFEEYLEKF
jgi:hypothetical protein